jgi:hypothetical protein
LGLTTSYPIGDERRGRFNFGTKTEAWTTTTRCWEIEVISERIMGDIMDFPNVFKIFHDFVTEMNFRHGQQAQAINISLKLLYNNECNNNGLIY